MKNILVIMGGGSNVRFGTDLPKYLLPIPGYKSILEKILSLKSNRFDKVVLIINPAHENQWNVKKYVRKNIDADIDCIVLNQVTTSPVETIWRSHVLEKYKNDRLFFKDCDTTFWLEPDNMDNFAETYVVRKFGFQVNGKYSIVKKDGNIIEKPKIPWYKFLARYNANIGCYVFPPKKDLRWALFFHCDGSNIKSLGVVCGKLKPKMKRVKEYRNYENLIVYGKLINRGDS